MRTSRSSLTCGTMTVAWHHRLHLGRRRQPADPARPRLGHPVPGHEQVTVTGTALSGTRYYQLGGQTVAARTSAGSIDYLTGTQQGTLQRLRDNPGTARGVSPASLAGREHM